MEIKTITISDLPDFVKSSLYKNSKNCPITIHRAISQSKNPRADKNDPALIIALEKENIVGYIGFLPDKIDDNKVYWNSCWWVDSNYKTIAIPLLLKFLKEGREQIILTDLTPRTSEIIKQLKFFTVINLQEGFRGYLKFSLGKILPKRNKKLKPFKFLFTLFDNLANGIIRPKTLSVSLNEEIIATLNETDCEFITKHSKTELIKRNVPELEWILNNPWVKDSNKNYDNYHFTASAKDFNAKMVRLVNNRATVAIVCLRQLNHQLTIPFVYFEKECLNQVAQFIFNEAVKEKCISITTFNPLLKSKFSADFKFVIKRELNRDFAFHNSIQHIIKKPVILQDGDSDVAFC